MSIKEDIMKTATMTLAAAACLAHAAAGAADWPMLGCNPQRTNYTDEEIEFPYKFAWEVHFEPERVSLNCQPVIAGGRVFVGTKSGNLYALDMRTGEQVWKYEAGGIIEHTAGVDDEPVFVACLDGTVHAVDRETGKGLWKFQAASGFSASVLPVDGRVYIGARDGNFYALDQAAGEVVWCNDLGAPIFQSAAWNKGRVYVGAEDMSIRCLDGKDGRQVWVSERLFGQSLRQFHPVIVGDSVAVIVMGIDIGLREGPGVFTWNPADAFRGDKEQGKAWLEEAVERLALGEGLNERMMADQEEAVALLTKNPEWQLLYILNESDGQQRYIAPSWRGPTQGGPACAPVKDCDGRLIVPVTFGSHRYGRLDLETGRIIDVLIGKSVWRLREGRGWQLEPALTDFSVGGGNLDEMMALSCAGPVVFFAHPTEGGAHYNGTFDLRERIYVDFQLSWGFYGDAGKTPFSDNALTRGQPYAVASGMFFHNSYGRIRAFRGAGGKNGKDNAQ